MPINLFGETIPEVQPKRKRHVQTGPAPSAYQQAILDFQRNGTGHCCVEATAGSGKTTLLTMLLGDLPTEERNSSVFIAFNVHIAQEIAKKLPQVKVRTVHKNGLALLNKHLKGIDPEYRILVDEDGRKMDRIIRWWLDSHGRHRGTQYEELVTSQKSLVEMVQLTLSNPLDWKVLDNAVRKFGVVLEDREKQYGAIPLILQWALHGLPEKDHHGKDWAAIPSHGNESHISFTEMIYLPIALDILPYQYRHVFADEAQDFSSCQRENVFRMVDPSGRLFYVADPRQAIYGFAYSEVDSVEQITKLTNATSLPLAVCYRCPVSHVSLAKAIVPTIEPAPGKEEGKIEHVSYRQAIKQVKPGDMIICRCTAPLVSMCIDIWKEDKPAVVRGQEPSDKYLKLLSQIQDIHGWTGDMQHFPEFLSRLRSAQANMLISKGANTSQIQSSSDRFDVLESIYESRKDRLPDLSSLKLLVRNVFDQKQDGREKVMLSTIHKAKGLEANSVYILRYDLIPHPMSSGSPELAAQESNLQYIALTRAKKELYFIDSSTSLSPDSPAELDLLRDAISRAEGKLSPSLLAPARKALNGKPSDMLRHVEAIERVLAFSV